MCSIITDETDSGSAGLYVDGSIAQFDDAAAGQAVLDAAQFSGIADTEFIAKNIGARPEIVVPLHRMAWVVVTVAPD